MNLAAPPVRSFARGTVSRDAAWSLAYSAVVRLATLAASVVLARMIGPSGTGAFGVALQVTALGSMLATFNLPQSLSRHLASTEDPARRHRLLRTSGWLLLGLSTLTGTALMALSSWLARSVYHVPELAPVLFWCGPLVIATSATSWVEGALQGLRRFSSLTLWGVLVSVLDLTLGSLAAAFGVVWVLVSRSMIRALAAAGAVARWFRGAPAATSPGTFASTAAPLLGFAGPTLLATATVLATQTVLRLLLVRSSALVAAGQYQAADSIAQGLSLIPTAASIAFMRSVAMGAEAGYPGLAVSLRRGLERLAGSNLPLCLLLMGVLPWATVALFGHEFTRSRPVLVLLSVSYGLQGPSALFGAAILGRGEVWTGAFLNLMWAGVVLGAFTLAGAPLGAVGAAIAMLSGYFVLLVVCALALAPRWSVPLKSLAPAILATVGSLALGCSLALTPGVPPLVTALVCVALAGAVAVRWGLPAISSAARGAGD